MKQSNSTIICTIFTEMVNYRLIRMLFIKESKFNRQCVVILVWADNGDTLSIQYAGTGALKSDFTRLGKRTTYGLMRDGVNSLQRYFINNFFDGFRQVS